MLQKIIFISTIIFFASCRKTPVACFDVKPAKPASGVLPYGSKVILDGSCSSNTSDWIWDFGDGTPRTSGMKTEHQYNKEGTFALVLYAKNGSKIDSAGTFFLVQK